MELAAIWLKQAVIIGTGVRTSRIHLGCSIRIDNLAIVDCGVPTHGVLSITGQPAGPFTLIVEELRTHKIDVLTL